MSQPVGPYSPSVSVPDGAGGFVFTSGQLGLVEGALVSGGVAPQLRQAIKNLGSVLADAGVTLNDVVKTTVFLADINDYAEMNTVYVDEFHGHRPARSAMAVAALPLGAVVEIEAVASIPQQ